MTKYHLLLHYKTPINSFFKKYIRRILLFFVFLCVIYAIRTQIKISKLSQLKEITVSRALELITEVKTLPYTEESEDSWKVVDIKDSRIYSAYLETRSQVVLEENQNLIYNDSAWAFIRIIAIIPVNLQYIPLTCYYKYTTGQKSIKSYIFKKAFIRAQLIAYKENFNMYYSAAFILCPLPYPEEINSQSIKLPYKITVSTRSDRSANNINRDEFVGIRYPNKWYTNDINININSHQHKDRDRKTFSVCVKPFHHNFDKAIDLITFIEFYKMMGVNYLTFYRDSVSEHVDKVLNYYIKEKIVSVLKWKLPEIYIFQRTLRTDGIFAALNDCLYRNTFHEGVKYIIGVDIDEYIVPRIHENYTVMMEHLNSVKSDEVGGWIFRNVFYYLMYDDDLVTLPPGSPKLNLHYKTRRWKEINPAYDRSKYIVQGENVIELGNHRVWKTKRTWSIFGTRYKEVEVDPKVGTSNHYRFCETSIENCWKRESIVDKTTHRFTKELSDRVSKVLKDINL
ncbi:uncharacterized protein LOC130665878 isoform X1 [Microplitis mediator]|uniref:uncharacterized protein LOC130665878 isoform X1 n=1 Tax=Microplitis mediator TaxID=375433 RepID=UPI002553C31F|nr:uncharacterized protein LOC130665878 isoform X1 [Microplitis mediator]